MSHSFFQHFVFFSILIALLACGNQDGDPQQALSPSGAGNPALEALTASIASNPNDPDLYANRAQLYYENEGYDEAIRDLSQALSLDSTNVDYLHLLADVYLDYYQSREALRTVERAAALYPERIPTLLKLSEFQLILRQYDASLKTIDRILQIDPRNGEAYFMLGMNFKETGDTARSVNSFQEAVEIDPDNTDAWINLGQLQAALGNRIAEQYFNSAVASAPLSLDALHAKAEYLTDQNRLGEALEIYRRMTILDPQYEEAFYNSGLLYMEMDSIEAAFHQFDLAINVEPLHVRAYFFRGLAAELLGRTGQALNDYQQALQLQPDYVQAQEGLDRIRQNTN